MTIMFDLPTNPRTPRIHLVSDGLQTKLLHLILALETITLVAKILRSYLQGIPKKRGSSQSEEGQSQSRHRHQLNQTSLLMVTM